MAFPTRFTIKEDMAVLRKELRYAKNELMRKRLRTLIVYKKHEGAGIGVREVAQLVGVDRGSAMDWRNAYIAGGLAGLLSHERTGNRTSVVAPHQREELREKLYDAQNGLRGYTELVAWFNDRFAADVKYQTMNQFVKRKYGTLCKVARKSHVKKEAQAVESFKKTSRSSARS